MRQLFFCSPDHRLAARTNLSKTKDFRAERGSKHAAQRGIFPLDPDLSLGYASVRFARFLLACMSHQVA